MKSDQILNNILAWAFIKSKKDGKISGNDTVKYRT